MEAIIKQANNTNAQLCVTGNAFNRLFEGTIEELSPLKIKFLECVTIYARTKPNDKAKIVMVYQHTNRTVSMCGDGANDCGALKQADIGLSLSQA
jgi:cation-transporting ATPase 13A3/4/5